MKNIFKLLLIVVTILVVSSCEDFLEKSPHDALDATKIGETQADGLRNSVYAQIPGSEIVFKEGYADNGYSRNWWDSPGGEIQKNTISGDRNLGYGEWGTWGDPQNTFSFIRVCNMLMEKANEFEGLDQSKKDLLIAEARLVRAWHYMDLTLTFGDVSLVTTTQTSYDKLVRNPKDEVRQWVLDEIDIAIENLPATTSTGRFNKMTGYALKARAAYYFGIYQVAESTARNVIDNGGYSLNKVTTPTAEMSKDAEFFSRLVDFDALGLDSVTFIDGIFNYNSIWYDEFNGEVILSKEYYATPENGDFNAYASFLPSNLTNKEGWAVIAPIQNLVDDYWMADGTEVPSISDIVRTAAFRALDDEINAIRVANDFTFSQAMESIINEIASKSYMAEFLNRDSRLYASIVFPFSAINTFTWDASFTYHDYVHESPNSGRTGFIFRKMANKDGEDVIAGGWGDNYYFSGRDFPVIRLAEMLLIYAEAHTQNTGYDASVTTELNKLRERCGMPDVPVGLNKEDALNLIRRERRIELAGEGFRFHDIRLYEDSERNGGIKGEQAASVVMQGQTLDPYGNLSALLTWAPRLMLMPIRTLTLDKNPDIEQNPGY